jgi:hypothetical protein
LPGNHLVPVNQDVASIQRWNALPLKIHEHPMPVRALAGHNRALLAKVCLVLHGHIAVLGYDFTVPLNASARVHTSHTNLSNASTGDVKARMSCKVTGIECAHLYSSLLAVGWNL